jgi:hypothetical protein
MKTIHIHAAQPAGPHQVEPVEIVIVEELPNFNVLENQDAYCNNEANELEEALINALPGATYDRLFAAMCARKASHLRVAHRP